MKLISSALWHNLPSAVKFNYNDCSEFAEVLVGEHRAEWILRHSTGSSSCLFMLDDASIDDVHVYVVDVISALTVD